MATTCPNRRFPARPGGCLSSYSSWSSAVFSHVTQQMGNRRMGDCNIDLPKHCINTMVLNVDIQKHCLCLCLCRGPGLAHRHRSQVLAQAWFWGRRHWPQAFEFASRIPPMPSGGLEARWPGGLVAWWLWWPLGYTTLQS